MKPRTHPRVLAKAVSFSFYQEDQDLLTQLAAKLDANKSEVLRRALALLAKENGLHAQPKRGKGWDRDNQEVE